MHRHIATKVKLATRNDGEAYWQCSTCLLPDRDPVHLQHRHSCRDRYGRGTRGCEACDHRAETIRATGCTTDPYSATCGHAMDDKPGCVCGRYPSTD